MGLRRASCCKRPRCSKDDGDSAPACEDEEQGTISSIQSLAARAECANFSRIFSKLEQMVLLLPAASKLQDQGGEKPPRGSQLLTSASRRLQGNVEAGGLSVSQEDAALEPWKVHIKCHTIDVMPEGQVIMQRICDEFERLSSNTQDRHSPPPNTLSLGQQRLCSADLLSYGSSVHSCSRRLIPDPQGRIWGGTNKRLTIDVEFEEHFAAILNVE